MNLVLDIGNTLSKIGFFEGNELVDFKEYTSIDVPLLKEILSKKEGIIKNSILSTVQNENAEITAFLEYNFHHFHLNKQLPIPLENLYKTPETLGNDRIAAAVAAATIFPKQNNLTIDAGTCITIDFINTENQYLGGAILPGIEMKFKAVNTFTAKLPLLGRKNNDSQPIVTGNDTESSIFSGILNGSLFEIQGFIEHYQKQYKQINIIFTGGDHKYFVNNINFRNFAEANLVMKGLNIILNFNANY